MRAVKIDPVAREIAEIDLANPNASLAEIKGIIGAESLTGDWLDPEILLIHGNAADAKFTFLGDESFTIAGVAIAIGCKGKRFKALQENRASFDMLVEWAEPQGKPAETKGA